MVGADSMKWGPMFLLVANLLMGCEAPQPYYYRGMNLLDVEFVFADVEHGTYPNTGILNHPTNPIDQLSLRENGMLKHLVMHRLPIMFGQPNLLLRLLVTISFTLHRL